LKKIHCCLLDIRHLEIQQNLAFSFFGPFLAAIMEFKMAAQCLEIYFRVSIQTLLALPIEYKDFICLSILKMLVENSIFKNI